MCSLAEVYNISPILLTMSTAIVMANTNGIITRKFTNALTQWSPPVYLMFFVLIGTKLDFGLIRSYAFLIMLVGPILVKYGLGKANELKKKD